MAPQVSCKLGVPSCSERAQSWQRNSESGAFNLSLYECLTDSTQLRPLFPVLDDIYGWAGRWPDGNGAMHLAIAVQCLPEYYHKSTRWVEALMTGEAMDWLLLCLSHNIFYGQKEVCTVGVELHVGLGNSGRAQCLDARYLDIVVAAIVRTLLRCCMHTLLKQDPPPQREGMDDFVATGVWLVGFYLWDVWCAHGPAKLEHALQPWKLGVQCDAGADDRRGCVSISHGGSVLLTIEGDNNANHRWLATLRYNVCGVAKTICLRSAHDAVLGVKNDLQLHDIDGNQTIKATLLMDPDTLPSTKLPQPGSRLHRVPVLLLDRHFAHTRTSAFQTWYQRRFNKPGAPQAHTVVAAGVSSATAILYAQLQTQEMSLLQHALKTGGCYHVVYPGRDSEYTLCASGPFVSTLHHMPSCTCPSPMCLLYTIVDGRSFDTHMLLPLQAPPP